MTVTENVVGYPETTVSPKSWYNFGKYEPGVQTETDEEILRRAADGAMWPDDFPEPASEEDLKNWPISATQWNEHGWPGNTFTTKPRHLPAQGVEDYICGIKASTFAAGAIAIGVLACVAGAIIWTWKRM